MRGPTLTAVLAAAVATATVHSGGAPSPRVSADISFGWRFALGHRPCSTYPIPVNDQQVSGLSEVNAATDPASCLAAACTQGADVYQWCVGNGEACGAASCWVGAWPGSASPQKGWVSGRVNASAPIPTPPEVAPAFPDDAWPVLDLPHDYEVAGVYTQSGNQGEGEQRSG